jgi:hypothetical protein
MYRPALILCALIPLLLAPGRARAAEEDAGADGKITELSELARQFPRHAGPTMLYVNFDGWKDYDGKGHDILPFRAKDGTRGPAIQLILFRTAEMFAPFDVQVRRLRTSGKRDERDRGNTTVFVGSNTATVDAAGKKHINNYTPGTYSDWPGETRGADHRPNSDPFDFAFVEAGQGGKSGWTRDPAPIARTIAHEAGHTFGLVHTLTDGVQEIMSYDTLNVFFANRPFPISNLNYVATKGKALPAGNRMYPRWGRRWITRQNSYAYLRAVLGARRADDIASVADRGAVDPSFRDAPPGELRPGSPADGSIEHRGDYDVFVLRPEKTRRLAVRVAPAEDSKLAPVLFVFDADGRKLLAFANGKARPDRVARVALDVHAGRSCKVVVGAADCGTAGAYQLNAGPVSGKVDADD